MATETEQLVVSLEARIRDFERNFQKANRTANDNFSRIEKRAKQSGDRMEKSLAGAASRVGGVLKNFGAGFAGGILGGLSVAGLQQIARGVGDVAKSVAMIGSQAKMAGLTTKAFQELSYVAEQSRISVDTLADGMKELALRADEWITTGGGAGAEAFQRLGYGAEELKVKLKDPSALLVDIIARLQQLDKAAQIRIADELFGGSAGERFVELLDRGANGIRAMIAEAHSFGLVLDDDVIAKADEIDRKFNLISRTIGTRMKGAIVSAAGELFEFMDKMREVEERQSTTLGNQLSELGMRRLENEAAILKLRDQKDSTIGGALLGPAYDKQIEHLEQEQREIAEGEARILKILADRDAKNAEATKAAADAVPDITKLNTAVANTKTAGDAGAKGMMTYADAIRALKGEIPELAEEVAKLDARAKIDKAYSAAIQNARSIGEANQAYALRQQALASIGKTVPGKGGSVTDASDEAAEKARQQIEAYAEIVAGAQEFIAVQGQEAQALGMSADAATAFRYEMDMLNQAKRDGIDLTADQRNEISAYAQGMAQAEKITKQFAQSQEDAAEVSRFFGEQAVDALSGLLTGTTTAKDALRQLIAALIRAALQAAFLGEGPLAALFGGPSIFGRNSIFSGSSAASTAIQSGAPATQTFAAPVGEVTRAALAPIQQATEQAVEGLRGSLGIDGDGAAIAKTVQPAMQDAATGFAKSITLTPQEITDLKKTLFTEWVPKQGDMQGKGIIDTILNRRASGKWGDSITDVVNARKQFSAINGPISWNGRDIARGVQDIPDSVLLRGRGKLASDLVDRYLPERAAGAPSVVGDHLNYANRAHSTPNNFGWIDKLQGPKFGGHQHGTTADLDRFRPGQFGVNMPGVDPMTTSGIDEAKAKLAELGQAGQQAATQMDQAKTATTTAGQQEQLAAQQEMAAKQQLAIAQQQHAAATTTASGQVQSAGAMAQGAGPQFDAAGTAIQSAGSKAAAAASQAQSAAPGMGGLGGAIGGLMGPLSQAVPGLGQFGGAVMSLIQQLLSMPMGGGVGGIFGSLFGFADGGRVRGPGTATSDSIPAMLSDGEFVVNAKATKKHRAMLEAINAGKVPMLATGGMIGGGMFAPSSTYAPSLAINVAGSGNPRQDARLASHIADEVDKTLKANQPKDTFRRSQPQLLGDMAMQLRRAGTSQL